MVKGKTTAIVGQREAQREEKKKEVVMADTEYTRAALQHQLQCSL